MAKVCRGCEDPQTQTEGIDCDGNFILDECVVLSTANVYFGLPAGSKLSELILKIVENSEYYDGQISKMIKPDSLPVYTDNVSAIAGGLSLNDPYRTPTGELRVVV